MTDIACGLIGNEPSALTTSHNVYSA